MRIFSGGMPRIFAALFWSNVGNWVPHQMSHSPSPIFTVQFSGSIAACAR